MKAVLCHTWGTPADLTLEEVVDPQPGPGEILIRVHACGVNFADTLMIGGQYQYRPEFPFSPGMEMAGEVIGCGDGVTDHQPGDRVMAVQYTGGFAEQAVLPAEAALPLPPTMDYPTAAAFPATYSTAHIALTQRGNLHSGETLLVLGAAGGIGLAAVEIGALLGAKVIAGASSEEKLAVTRAYGAAETINYREESLRKRVRDLTDGRGADVIFDPVGGDLFKQAMRCVAWEGRLLVVGFASGQIPSVSVNRLLIQNYALVGVEWGTYMRNKRALVNESLATLIGWHAEGKIRPRVSATYPLEDVPLALEKMLKRETTGRVVIAVP